MYSTFPNISYELSKDSSCSHAQKLNGGRNLAQVLLDTYNAIPLNLVEFRELYCEKIDAWLKQDVFYTAPELFPSGVWRDAGRIMGELFAPHRGSEWEEQCSKIYRNVA
jgi:hypothetical protein